MLKSLCYRLVLPALVALSLVSCSRRSEISLQSLAGEPIAWESTFDSRNTAKTIRPTASTTDLISSEIPFPVPQPSSDGPDGIPSLPWWSGGHIVLAATSIALLLLLTHLLMLRIQRWSLRAVLEERERLALDMHDTLAQSFAGIAYQLQAVRDETPSTEPAHQHLEMALAMVQSSHEEAKRCIAALRPEYLGKSDLVEALHEYVHRIVDDRSLRVIPIRTSEAKLPLAIADAMFRIGEEAISNVIRHAHASTLLISLSCAEDLASLTIQDDGCGFSSGSKNFSLGIRGMEKRARNIGASLRVSSSEGHGTTVTVIVPLQPAGNLVQRIESILDFFAGA